MELLLSWLRAFSFTFVVELLAAPPLLGQGWSWQRRVATAALAQIASHPAVWFIFPLVPWSRTTFLVVAESWAVLLETGVYALALPGLRPTTALRTAFIANALSYGLGTLVRLFWPWF